MKATPHPFVADATSLIDSCSRCGLLRGASVHRVAPDGYEVDDERTTVKAPVPFSESAANTVTVTPDQVHGYLSGSYPAGVLGWVHDGHWQRKNVPLTDVNMARRPGGRDDAKVAGIEKAIGAGRKMDPVVLVKNSDGQHDVADGYHRTLAMKHLGLQSVDAYVGQGFPDDGPWQTQMHAAKFNRPVPEAAAAGGTPALLTTVGSRTLLTCRAEVVRSADQVPREMAARWELAAARNPHFLFLQGRFVEAERANVNGAFWSTEDLQFGEPSVRNGPLNMLHDLGAIVGCLSDGQLFYPEQAAGRPHIVAQAVVWKSLFPKAAAAIERAAEAESIWFSMECTADRVRCETSSDGTRQGCGQEFSWEQARGDARGACEHVRHRTSQRRMVNPSFMGAAIILPPVKPAWGDADVELVKEAARQVPADHGIDEAVIESLMAEIFAYGLSPSLV
jgi:hypothetical protein